MKRSLHDPSLIGILHLAVFVSLVVTSRFPFHAGIIGGVLAIVVVTTIAWLRWQRHDQTQLPIWALLCSVHTLMYGVAALVADRMSPSVRYGGADLPEASVALALLCGFVNLVAMWGGRRLAGSFLKRDAVLAGHDEFSNLLTARCRVAVAIGILYHVVPGLEWIGGVEMRNLMLVMIRTVPLAAFLYLLQRSLKRGSGVLESTLLAGYSASLLLAGASRGAVLGTILMFCLVSGMTLWIGTRRVPWIAFGIVLALLVFLQPTKGEMRIRLSVEDVASSPWEALPMWFGLSAEYWMEASSSADGGREGATQAANRASILSMAALVLQDTPDVVPYRYGEFYGLVFANVVPRLLWPGKPTVNMANQSFQVDYGLTQQEDLGNVSIACGFAAEGYMNFGWAGVVVIGLLTGIVFRIYEVKLFGVGAGPMEIAFGLALLPVFLNIEGQLNQYIGGVVQSVAGLWAVLKAGRGSSPLRAGKRSLER